MPEKTVKIKADIDKILTYLEKLVKTPSPTGYTGRIVEYLAFNAQAKRIPYEITRKGAILYKFERGSTGTKTMLAVHVDTLGAIVKKVERDKVMFDAIGGYPVEYVVGNYCTIHTFDGNEIPGTIMPKNPAVHVNADLKEKKLKFDDMAIRVDIKLKDKSDTLEKYIEVGNFISLDPSYKVAEGFVKSRHLDDKASAAILLHAADSMAAKFKDPKFMPKSNYYFFFNVTEETGQGIAGYPDINDLLVVDMGALGDGLQGDEYSVSICAKDATGPYHYEFTQELIKICKAKKIPFKMDVFPFYGSDGSGALRAGRDMRVALIGPGVGASHGYERTHVDSISAANKLVQEFLFRK